MRNGNLPHGVIRSEWPCDEKPDLPSEVYRPKSPTASEESYASAKTHPEVDKVSEISSAEEVWRESERKRRLLVRDVKSSQEQNLQTLRDTAQKYLSGIYYNPDPSETDTTSKATITPPKLPRSDASASSAFSLPPPLKDKTSTTKTGLSDVTKPPPGFTQSAPDMNSPSSLAVTLKTVQRRDMLPSRRQV